MHSKERPWSFFQSFPLDPTLGFFAVFCYDPYLERMIQSRWSAKVKKSSYTHHVLMGHDLTPEWMEDNLSSPDLFAQQKSYTIFKSEDIPLATQQALLDYRPENSTLLFLSFSRARPLFEKIRQSTIATFAIEAPKFWESEQLLNFLAKELKVPLNQKIKGHILRNIPHEAGPFINALKLIILHYKEITSKTLPLIIPPSRVDNFELASLYSKKQFKRFFSQLLSLDISPKEWQRFFNFMTSHLIKLTGKLEGRSQYEKNLAKQQALWSWGEIQESITLFGDLQTAVKTGNINSVLKTTYLKYC
jgi:hypothetical protein